MIIVGIVPRAAAVTRVAGGDVLRLVMRQGMNLTLAGIVAGLVRAFAIAHTLSSLLYRGQPADPETFACVPPLLGAVALVASYIPALRATRVDPMFALKYE